MFFTEFVEKGKPERRYVEYKDNNITHSSDRMAIEWWSWLHNRRETVPTNAEIAASARALQKLAERVAVLEAEDERQRLRQQNMNVHRTGNDGDQYSGPNADAAAAVLMGGSSGRTDASANQEEVGARRRRKALERLKNASAPGAGMDSAVVSTPKSGEFNHERNVHEEPTVCYVF